MTRRTAWLLLLPLFVGCRCGPGPVEPIDLGLRVQPAELDFGRVLEGTTKVATVTLTSATRAAIGVQLATDAPFSVASSAEVPGGGDTTVEVSFRAGDVVVEGVLRISVGDRTAQLKLRGEGVRPPDCRPSAECVVSVYSLEEDRCLESQAADDAPCDTASVCLEQGRCRAGQCLGIARRCDDNDVCTDDACAMDLGCIHTPHLCPAPTAACQVATCDPRAGCGQGPAPDLTLCGPQDCVEVNFCISGSCRTQPTPEGLPCSPAIACLPEAECHQQACTRVTDADWLPEWSARLEGEPTGELASSGATLFFSTCVPGADAGELDGGGDGGADAGEPDAGLDAGHPLVCGLASYTGTGFERFVRPYDDDAPRAVWGVNGAGVLVRRDGGLELRSPVTGGLRSELELELERSLLVLERERLFFWADGGVQIWVDGGVSLLAELEQPTAMGRGSALFAWNPDAGLLTRLELLGDGGVDRKELSTTGVGSAALAVAGNTALFGAVGRARLDASGSASVELFDWSDAGATRFLEELTLSSAQATNVFFLRCDGGCGGPEQETGVRVFDTDSGLPLWETVVASPAFPGTMLATTLLDGRAGAFTTVMRSETPGGPRAVLAIFADGERKAVCRLPEASGAVELAHFSASSLVVTVRRPDGGVSLESYPLGELPVSRSTWSTPQGVGGTRSDRP